MNDLLPTSKPNVLLLDDAIEQVANLQEALGSDFEVNSILFQDIQDADIEAADLIVVDFDLSLWIEKDNATSAALRPADGLAVIETLRSHLRRSGLKRPTAFVILSGELQRLTDPYKANRRPHLISALSRVEWVFEKGTSTEETSRRLRALANATAHLPDKWPHDPKSTKVETLQHQLNLSADATWRPTAIEDITKCHPPLQELSTWSHGLAFLRWLLQRILPYSTFLVDDYYLSARLGLSLSSLSNNLNEGSLLHEKLQGCCYKGILADFDGRRWWRAGIDHVLWTMTQSAPFSRSHVRECISALVSNPDWLTIRNPVCIVDEDYRTVGIADSEECVQLRPDDWPSYADAAWAERTLVAALESMRLALVAAEDRAEFGGVDTDG